MRVCAPGHGRRVNSTGLRALEDACVEEREGFLEDSIRCLPPAWHGEASHYMGLRFHCEERIDTLRMRTMHGLRGRSVAQPGVAVVKGSCPDSRPWAQQTLQPQARLPV